MGWTAVWRQRCCALALPCLLGLLALRSALSQELREGDAVCTESNGCFVLYMQRKTFLYAWRSCKERGGDLATLKEPRDAAAVERLFAGADLRGKQGKVRAWIGLQRLPRQCSAARPLRGFSWVTGDQDTRFANWLGEDSASTCTAPRCVVVTYVAPPSPGHEDNLKWTDGPCSISVDAYLCKYNNKGVCPSIASEGGGNTFYSTPFDLLTTRLTYLPYGSVATVPCPVDTVGDQTVLCTDMSDGTVNWSREPPYCSLKQSWCDQDNGGCHQLCIDKEDMHVCMCIEGYVLAEDGMSCLPDDPCLNSPCQSECVPVSDGYRCSCPEGYVLAEDGMNCMPDDPCLNSPCEFECVAVSDGFRCDCPEGYVLEPDEHSCRDLDECQQMPCERECINTPGSYQCRCLDGFEPDESGVCEDVDECLGEPCQHACENTPGSHICHCRLGYTLTPEDPSRCQDFDECQIEDMCEHMCVNYDGGFACFCQEGYKLQADQHTCSLITESLGDHTATPAYPMWNYPWATPNMDYDQGPVDYDWMTDRPSLRTQDQDEWFQLEPLVPTPMPTTMPVQTDYDQESDTDSLGLYASTENLEPTETQFPMIVEMLNPTTTTTLPTPTPTPTPTENLKSSTTLPQPTPTTHDSTTPEQYYYKGEEETDAPPRGVELGTSNCVISTTTEERISEHSPDESDFPSSTPSGMNVEGVASAGDPEEEKPVEEEAQEEEGGSWLLVGLLVPLCIILLVMVVLGAIYCTRGSSAKPQNKNSSDCYHWISGAADKAGAEHSGAATKSHV